MFQLSEYVENQIVCLVVFTFNSYVKQKGWFPINLSML